jgi:restriction system protein
VGVKAIQEAVASKGYYECEKAMVVTNSYFTNQAKDLARRNGVDLWDRKILVRELLKIKHEGAEVASLAGVPPGDMSKCFKCGVEVSPKVRQYCLDHSERFGSKVFCFKHQREDEASGGADRLG